MMIKILERWLRVAAVCFCSRWKMTVNSGHAAMREKMCWRLSWELGFGADDEDKSLRSVLAMSFLGQLRSEEEDID